MIETVQGEIKKEILGITMAHEHLVIDLNRVRGQGDSSFNDVAQVVLELSKLQELGGQAIVEVTGIDMGRDIKKLKQISKASSMHVIAATGFYLKPYHPEWLELASIDKIEALFLKEIQEGIDDTPIKAGIIGEVATSRNKVYPTEEKVLRAAARASVKTNTAVSTHCDMGTMGSVQYEILKEEGMDPRKIILGHLDLIAVTDYHEDLLKQGVNIAFDTIGKTAYCRDETRAEGLCTLIHKGYGNQIVLSQDVSRQSYFQCHGGGGYGLVLEKFIPLLKACGVSLQQINSLLIDNPARILDR